MGRLILVTGGARSGKSTFAEQLAAKLGGDNVLFIATAEALDDDMRNASPPIGGPAHRRGRRKKPRAASATGSCNRWALGTWCWSIA